MSIALECPGTLFVLVAPSGGGKSTVLRALMKNVEGMSYSVSCTSRLARPNEFDGVDYHFIGLEAFLDTIERKEFYEWARVHGNYYGTRKDTVEKLLAKGLDVGMDLDVQGAYAIKGMKPEAVTVFLLPPSMQVLEKRLRARDSDDEAVIRLRLENAADEISHYRLFDYLVVNDNLDRVIPEISGIVAAERHRGRRQRLIVHDEPAIEALMKSKD